MKTTILAILALLLGTLIPGASLADPPQPKKLTLEEWTLAALTHFADPEKSPQLPGWEETPDQARERYVGIAAAIAGITKNRDEAGLLVALAIGESRLARDTDIGPCYRGKPGSSWQKRCDSGTSGSVWQVKTPVLGPEGETVTYLDTFKDRTRAAKIAFRLAKGSLGACKHLEPIDRLSALGGKCTVGLESARQRWRLWQRVRVWEPKE